MEDDLRYMRIALDLCSSAGLDIPVACLVIKDGQIIAQGLNCREALNDPCGHAEIVAIRQAAKLLKTWRLDELTVYCTLEPCPMCAEAMIQSRVAKIVFGAYDTVGGAAGSFFNLFVPRKNLKVPQVIGGILEQECQAKLLAFFQGQRHDT